MRRTKPNEYSVFGFYDDNMQRAAFSVKAFDVEEAEAKAVKMGYKYGGNFRAVAVFGGNVRSIDTNEFVSEGQ